MKTQYRYALLDVSKYRCCEIGDGEKVEVSLPGLLEDGWRPVRETPIAGSALVLLVLEHDGGGQGLSGFGFGVV